MKRHTPDHPKMEDLAEALGIELLTAVGLMECLWHLTARFARRGDLGAKFTNKQIASRVHWFGDADRLINGLVKARWLEIHPEFRLVVHDWSDHADDSVKKTLVDNGETFWDGKEPYGGDRKTKTKKISRETREKSTLFDSIENAKNGLESQNTTEQEPKTFPAAVALPCQALLTTAPAAQSSKNSVEQQNSNGPEKKKPEDDGAWVRWDITGEVLRNKFSLPEPTVRELISRTRAELAKRGLQRITIEFFWEWLGIVYQSKMKSLDGTLSQGIQAYVMHWTIESLKLKKAIFKASQHAHDVAKNAYLALSDAVPP